MATIMESKISLGPELRPCYVSGNKAFFHRWIDTAEPMAASLSRGGAPAGQYWRVAALIETKDGHTITVPVNSIHFIDTQARMEQIAWPEPEEQP